MIAFLCFFISFVIFDKSSTDYNAYTNMFISGCNSTFPSHHEVAYHYSSFLFSQIFFINCDPIGFEIYKVLMFIILAIIFTVEIFSFVKKKYTGKYKRLVSAGLSVLLLLSVVPIQVIWNFRGGYSTIFALMFILLLITDRKTIFGVVRMLVYAALSISMHTQSVFAIAVFSFFFVVFKFAKNNFFLYFIGSSFLLLLFFLMQSLVFQIEGINMLNNYIGYKIQRYENYNTGLRATFIVYLIITLSVLYFLFKINIDNPSYALITSGVDFKVIKTSVVVYLITQVIWNFTGYSFMASRVARVFEPIIMTIFGFMLVYILSSLEFRARLIVSIGAVFIIIWSFKIKTLIV